MLDFLFVVRVEYASAAVPFIIWYAIIANDPKMWRAFIEIFASAASNERNLSVTNGDSFADSIKPISGQANDILLDEIR